MKNIRWEIKVALSLGSASLVLYLIHFACFRDVHAIGVATLTSLAFLPISVMVVTLIINRLLSVRERAVRLEKLRMLVAVFFGTLGTRLLLLFSSQDQECQRLQAALGSPDAWNATQQREVRRILAGHSYTVAVNASALQELRTFLLQQTDYLLRLLENSTLLEHERFTELLRAVFHLHEELSYRNDFCGLPDSDLNHLAGDISRCYGPLVREWADYLWHLKENHPYLFSLAVRTNPFDRNASIVVS
jgi:hypothetical protein